MMCDSCSYLLDNGFCIKIDGIVSDLLFCEEEVKVKKKESTKRSNINRYERKMKYKRKLKRIADAPRRYPGGAYYQADFSLYCNSDTLYPYWIWVKENAKYIKRCYRANHAPGYSGYLKKLASRKFRRYKDKIANGCAYKKTFDYWWELT